MIVYGFMSADISAAVGEQHLVDGDQLGWPRQRHFIGDLVRVDIR